jgi:hypothetical protein
MTWKAFRVEKLSDFLSLADQVSSPKFLDKDEQAFFYARKRIEYIIQDREDMDKLIKHGFIAGEETETFESW